MRIRSLLSLMLFCCLMCSRAALAADDAPALPVLVYHQIRIAPDGPPDSMTCVAYERFQLQMRYLHEQGYKTLSMDEIVQFLHGKKFPEKIVALQFDDGWLSAVNALPVLGLYGFKATFWAIPGTVGTPYYMDWPMLQDIDKNQSFRVYSHSMTHPWEDGNTFVDWAEGRTAGKSEKDVMFELAESKKILEEKLGHKVPYFAWPSGFFNDRLVELGKQAGYEALITTVDRPNHPDTSPWLIHRTMVNGRCDDEAFRRIVASGKYEACGS